MKQLYLKCLFLGILSLIGITANAYDCEVGGIYYNLNKTDCTASVTYESSSPNFYWGNYLAYIGSIIIPSTFTYKGTTYSVTSIGENAFNSCSILSSVTIPESVTSIEKYAFEGCSDLTSITIPSSVTSIKNSTFRECKSLTSVILPSSVTIIENLAFYNCNKLTSILIPDGVISIGNSAFEDCSSLTSIEIPNSVTSIGNSVFAHCTGLTSIEIPNSVTSIGNSAFEGCTSLTSISIGSGVTSIGKNAFVRTAWYDNQSDGLVYTGKVAYKYKGTMPTNTSITLKEETLGIASYAFSDCSGLTSIYIPNCVVCIGESAFSGCSSLISVTISGDVTSIENSVFYCCSSLTSIEIPNSVTSIGSKAFEGCRSLTTVNIPNSVDSIEYDAFRDCRSLTSITIPDGVTSIASNTFSGCYVLTSIEIPNSVTSIGPCAFQYCYGLTHLIIGNGVTNIGSEAFDNCCSLKSIISYNITPPTMGYYSVFCSSARNDAILYVPFKSLELYKTAKEWKNFRNIEPFDIGSSLTLNVTNEQNQDVTNKVSIFWYDGDGKELGTGNTLNGISEDADIYYSVLLDEELGRIYREVKMQKAEANGMTCQLEKIGRVMLKGRVSAVDIDKKTATVDVKQMLNGKYEQNYQTQTNVQGVFQVEVYDDVTDITISGDDFFDAMLHRDGFNGNGNIGTIPLNIITGFSIAANINLQKAVVTGEAEEVMSWNDGLNNIEFSLTNTTKNKEITDFTVQNDKVIIKSGADIGDEIRLVAKSKQGVFADAETTFVIEEGANAFDLLLTERGGVDAVCDMSNNGGTDGFLYNSDGVLVSMGSYIGETLSLRHLPKGVYTLVSIGRSLLLGSMTNLTDLASVGLTENEDYVTTRVEVEDREITNVRVNEVPQLVETKFYYTTNYTYFDADKSYVTVGNYLTLSSHLDFKPEHADKVDGVILTIDLPEGCQMVENSAIANRQPVAYTVNGKRVSFVLAPEQYQSQLRFCIMPSLSTSYTITAMASFNMESKVQQPIGTAQFEAKGLSVSVPQITANTNIIISGTAREHSEVSIYDNDVLIAKTLSKADGTWTTQAELFKPRSHSFHNIYAIIINENGMELTSETKQVEYNRNQLVPEKVTMLYNYRDKLIYNLLQGTTSSAYYSYNPDIHDFTFLADFTRNDTTLIKNVNIKVLNSDGTVSTLPANYDGKQNHWVATTYYSNSNRLPQNVTVDYEYYPTLSDEDREDDLMDEANKLASIAYFIKDYFDNKVEMTPIEDSEDYILFECRTSEGQSPLLYRIEGLDYSVMEELMKTHQFTYVESNDGIVGIYWESTDNGMAVYGVDITNTAAFKLTLYNPTVQTKAKAIDLRPAVKSLKESVSTGQFLSSFLKHFGNLMDLLTGIKEYCSVKGDFENMCNLIIQYQDNFLKLNQKTFKLVLAKCPDGRYRLSEEKRDQYFKAIQATSDVESIFAEQYYDYLQEYKNKLRASVGAFIGTFGLGKAFGALGKTSKFVSSKINRKIYNILNKNFSSYVFRTTSASILSSVIGTGFVSGINQIGKIFDYKDFNKVKDKVLSWSSKEYSGLYQNYISLQNGIKKAYMKCEKDPNHPNYDNDEFTDDKSDFIGKGATVLIDPSGYLYEAVLSNRLEGVTTTCYQQENGEAVVWNAEDYSQKNPLKTDETGFYRWDVPQGMWQVKYEKEGYETTYSEWLPVPPPQLDVNVGMKQSTPPTVTQMRGFESGITIDLSKYMLPVTLNETNITVTRNGFDEKGHIEFMNEEKEPKGEQTFASKVKFVPESLFNTSDLVVVTVHKEVQSYCGVEMVKDHVETVKIESEIKSILADSAITVPYQSEKELRILVLPIEASAGRILHVRSSSPMIASVSSTEVTIDQDGAATLTLGGELPGGAIIDFSVEGIDLTATSKVQVTIDHDLVATPTASILSGETIESGTVLTLSCETEGATIYYTLDGSCPCDETTRYRYDGPITIASDVIVKAIAVKEGMDDSDIATFVYLVNGINRVLVDNNIHIGSKDQTIIVTGAEGANCQIYDLQGRIAGGRSHLTNQSRFKVKSAGIYLLHITLPNGETTVGSVFVK